MQPWSVRHSSYHWFKVPGSHSVNSHSSSVCSFFLRVSSLFWSLAWWPARRRVCSWVSSSDVNENSSGLDRPTDKDRQTDTHTDWWRDQLWVKKKKNRPSYQSWHIQPWWAQPQSGCHPQAKSSPNHQESWHVEDEASFCTGACHLTWGHSTQVFSPAQASAPSLDPHQAWKDQTHWLKDIENREEIW